MRLPDFSGSEPCTEIGIEAYFYPDLESGGYLDKRSAIEACGRCSMQDACREYALKVPVYGIWGGTTEGERRKIRARLNIVPIKEEF